MRRFYRFLISQAFAWCELLGHPLACALLNNWLFSRLYDRAFPFVSDPCSTGSNWPRPQCFRFDCATGKLTPDHTLAWTDE